MKIIVSLLCVVSAAASAQSRFDYSVQVRGGPLYSDGNPAYTLAQNCARAGLTGVLSITRTWSAQLTQSLPCNLIFGGGKIQPQSGQTITVTGTTSAPSQLFDTSLGGTVALSRPFNDPYPVLFANRIACITAVLGSTAEFSDSSVMNYGNVITGGGLSSALAYCSPSGWILLASNSSGGAGAVTSIVGDCAGNGPGAASITCTQAGGGAGMFTARVFSLGTTYAKIFAPVGLPSVVAIQPQGLNLALSIHAQPSGISNQSGIDVFNDSYISTGSDFSANAFFRVTGNSAYLETQYGTRVGVVPITTWLIGETSESPNPGTLTAIGFQFNGITQGSLSSAGTFNAVAFTAGSSAGVSCSGSPTSSFASVNGIVTHC